MDAQEFRVQKFRCIDDTGWVDISDVTSLIGKNQSGKTAFLKAINKLNPVYGSGEYEPYEEYPRDEWIEYKERHEENPATVVEAKFQLEDDEISGIEEQYGEDVLPNDTVTVAKDYSNHTTYHFSVNEQSYIEDLISRYDLPEQTESTLIESDSIYELSENISNSDSEAEEINQIFGEIDEGELDLSEEIMHEAIKPRLPEFLYMGEYHFLEGRISMDRLIQRQSNNNLEEGDEVFLSLLSMSHLEATELRDNDNWDRMRTSLESAANQVSDYVLDYWTQNQNIRIEFDREHIPQNSSTRWNNERVVDVLVKNQDYRATIPFEQQSRGFRWFFSVFCQFTDLRDQDNNLIVLLDEPGLHLHAKAQQDFLVFLNEELSNEHKTIFTTHSPFMIDPRNLHQAKMVEADPSSGTNISEDVMNTGEDTRLPLQNAFEFDLIDTLLIRPQTLLVEGKSDHSYLYTMSENLSREGRTSLERKWTVIPVGSGSNVPTFVSLFGGNDLDIAVLLDADGNEHQRIGNIESRGVMDSEHIRDIAEFIEEDEGDIEDLFSTDFYMELVNRAYSGELAQIQDIPNSITTGDFGDDNRHPRLVKRLETYFSRYHINDGVFEHNKPAKYFQENTDRMVSELDEESMDNFESLFEDFNNMLSDFE
jgi:AAA15 family ATPase/GTPase